MLFTQQKTLSLLGLIALVGSLSLLGSCGQANDELADVGTNVTTEEVVDLPDAISGQLVTIRSAPEQVLGDSVFSVSDPRVFSDGAVLVVNATTDPFVIPSDGTEVQISGEVMPVLSPELAQQYNLDLNDQFYDAYREKPVIVAQSLALAPDPAKISENPSAFYNQTIAIEGDINEIYDAQAFTIDEEQLFGGQDLLVLGQPLNQSTEGNRVVVTGQIRPFIISEFDRDYDWTWDQGVKQKLEAEYSQRPVLVATEVYPMTDQ